MPLLFDPRSYCDSLGCSLSLHDGLRGFAATGAGGASWNWSNVITWGHQLFRLVLLGETCQYDLPAPSEHAQTSLKKVYPGLCEASELKLCPKFSDRTTQSRAVRNPLLRSSQRWRSCVRKLIFKRRFFCCIMPSCRLFPCLWTAVRAPFCPSPSYVAFHHFHPSTKEDIFQSIL